MNLSDVAEAEELSEPYFTHHADSADGSTYTGMFKQNKHINKGTNLV